MNTTFKYKLQTFFIATVVATILSGCATVSNGQADNSTNDAAAKAHIYRMHNYTFDN